MTSEWRLDVVWNAETTANGHYSDAVITSGDGTKSVVVCDSTKCRLLAFKRNGNKCVLANKASFRPFCMTNDEKGHILITKYNSTSLCHLDANKLKETKGAKKIKLAEQPLGLARLEGAMTVVAESNKILAIYDDSANCITRWRCDMQPQYVAAKNNIIVASFRDDNCIIAYDTKGTRKWKMQFFQPRGIAVDNDKVIV